MIVWWLETVPHIEGTKTLVEKAQGPLPPTGYMEWEWKVFLNQAEVEIVRGDVVIEGTSLIEVKQKLIPPTLNTLKRVKESLTMPHQPEESSSEAELWHRALERLRNSPKMNNSLTLSSSGETLDLRNRRNVPMERATHQHICHLQLWETGPATVPDQGIVFDGNNMPRDVKPEQKLKKEESVLTNSRGWLTPQKDFRQGRWEVINGGSGKRSNGPPKGRQDEPPAGPPEGGCKGKTQKMRKLGGTEAPWATEEHRESTRLCNDRSQYY